MSSDGNDIIDTTCSVCGAEVRGEKVLWKPWSEGLLDKDRIKALGAIEGSHVCGKCGTARSTTLWEMAEAE